MHGIPPAQNHPQAPGDTLVCPHSHTVVPSATHTGLQNWRDYTEEETADWQEKSQAERGHVRDRKD